MQEYYVKKEIVNKDYEIKSFELPEWMRILDEYFSLNKNKYKKLYNSG